MAKKKNIYSAQEFELTKEELRKTIEHLESQVIEDLIDEAEWKSNSMGGMTPYIISSIEDKIKTIVVVILDTAQQLKVISENEGLSNFVEGKIFSLKSKVRELQDYYTDRHPLSMQHRFMTMEKKVKPKATKNKQIGEEPKIVTLKLEAATKEEQTKVRSDVLKKLLSLTPILNSIESNEEDKLLKGGGEVPERMKIKFVRNND